MQGSHNFNNIPTYYYKFLPTVYILAISGVLFFAFSRWAYDDPFITYRYADNLRRGLGFVYNPGEKVLSTTTPLFTLLLAVLGNLWPDLPKLASLIGAISLTLGALFLWDLAQTYRTPWVGWASLALFPSFPLLLSTLGSETPLYLAFGLGAFACYARQKYKLAAVFAGLALLTRPDGVLVAGILGVDYMIRVVSRYTSRHEPLRSSIPWSALLIFLILVLPWFIFAWLYFGSPFPVTLWAKHNQGLLAGSERFAAGFLTIARYYLVRWHYRIEILLALVGQFYLISRGRKWASLLAWTGLYFLSYSLLGVSRYYWYYAPLVPGFIALVGLGLSALHVALGNWQLATRRAKSSQAVPQTSTLIVGGSVASLVVIALLISQSGDLWRIRGNPDARYAVYRLVGEWLEANAAPQARVGALEVGIIGYYAQRPMVDFAGIIQPEIAAHLTPKATYEDTALWAVDHYQPQYVILHNGGFPRLEKKLINMSCTVEQTFSGRLYQYSSDLNVYACR